MNKDAVQNERGPRNSTLRRQMAMYKESIINTTTPIRHEMMLHGIPYRPQLLPPMVLDLSVHRQAPIIPHLPYMPRLITHPIPPPPPPLMAMEATYEAAAQIFLENVHWIRDRLRTQLPQLPDSDQLTLLEDSWKDFFLIGAAQRNFNFSQLFCFEALNNVGRTENVLLIYKQVEEFQTILNKFASQNVDRTEYTYLREIILFATDNVDCFDSVRSNSTGGSPCSTSDSKHLRELNSVKVLYDAAKCNLKNYTSTVPGRFESLVEKLLPLFANVANYTIEELFFRRTIRDSTIIGTLENVYNKLKRDENEKCK